MIDNSYYIILNRLKAFANGHYLINTFTYHEIANFDITKNPQYPIMHVVPVSMNPTKGAIDYSFNITFADWVRAKEEKQENEVTVISDLHRCALDLCAEITNGNILFGDEVSINGDAVIEPFIDEFANVLSGVTLQITIRVPYNWSACDIPANWVEGTGDIPDFGGRSLTMDIYDEGDFIVSAREMDFIGENVTVTYTGNRAIVTITGGGGGAGTLQETTDNGNTTTNDIELINSAEVKFGAGGGVLLDNASRLREGTIDANTGGSKGIALICGVGYELKWEAGSQYAMNGNGDTIRVVNYKFNIVPSANDDSSKGFYVGSRWILDDGVSYVCTDATIGSAVWEIEVLPYIPLAGTDGTNLVTGSIVVDPSVANWSVNETNGGLLHEVGWEAGVLSFLRTSQGANIGQVTVRENTVESSVTDATSTSNFSLSPEVAAMSSSNGTDTVQINITPTTAIVNIINAPTFEGLKYNDDFSDNFDLRSLIDQEVLKKRIWTKAGTPTTTDDFSLGYLVGSLIWDTTNSILYRCTDNTGSAAVWVSVIPSLSGYVPYTGATTDVDLGTHNLTADHIALNTNPSGAGFVVGATEWNNTIGSSQTLLKGGNVILKNGVDLVARIVNKVTPNATLTKAAYQAVRVSGATGGRLSVALAQGNNDLNSADTIGLVCETIATNQEGFIITVGQLLNINTTGSLQGETWVDGDVLYLSPTTPGAITKVKPTGAGHIVVIGYVEYAHANNGAIYVKVMNGWELDELHDVSITSPTTNDVLYYASDSLWKNKALTKSDVGLGNVDNTSDADKPISTATQTALDLKKNKSEQRIFETTSNQSSTSTTRADVTELTVPLLAGKKYRIELYGMMQSPAVTTGCSVGFYLSAGTATINGIIRGLVQTSASTTALDQFINVVTTTPGATGSFFTTSGVGAINTPHALGGSFYVESASDCDFKFQFGSEVAGASTTLLSGSALIVDQLN